MRLLTAGSLVRVQLEAPPGKGLEPNALRVFCYVLIQLPASCHGWKFNSGARAWSQTRSRSFIITGINGPCLILINLSYSRRLIPVITGREPQIARFAGLDCCYFMVWIWGEMTFWKLQIPKGFSLWFIFTFSEQRVKASAGEKTNFASFFTLIDFHLVSHPTFQSFPQMARTFPARLTMQPVCWKVKSKTPLNSVSRFRKTFGPLLGEGMGLFKRK